MDRKLIRSGTGWCVFVNNTILQLLEINPETDMVKYRIENHGLILSKSPNKKLG
ncbi:MAG: hypothetical protein LBK53_08470 [Heliobacteriaceae bacterium]|jgi:hypothetical protein|nr:hypothetical protein [Heliobacteriaceae bacterium]